jgi:WD40 repeat protein
MKHQAPTCLLIIALASGLLMQAQTASQTSAPPPQPATITASKVCGGGQIYDQLTADERKPPPPRTIPLGKSPVELTISATEFSDRPVNAREAASPFFCEESTLWVGVNVSASGEGYGFANGEGADRGGGGNKLAPEDFARVQSLMDDLPDDQHRVPPATRRIVVEVQRDGTATVRLYDSASLPDAIVEMIRLTGARIKIAAPIFRPDRVLPPEEVPNLDQPVLRKRLRALTISPDGSVGVLHDFVTKTLTVYQGSTWPQNGGMPLGGKIIRVIPEFWQPPQYGGYDVNNEFSTDGRYLLVTWGKRIGALLFDTTTWQPITDPRLFPQNLKVYLPAPDWNLGIAVTVDGETLVWDQQSHRIVSKLPGLGEFEPPPVITNQQGQRVYDIPNAEIQSASFSPDRRRVAIFSGPDNVFKLRLSIWDVEAGKKERDLWPVAWTSYPSGGAIWWDYGLWLVGPYSSQYSGGGTGIWDVETGRFLGTLDFSGCDARVIPVIAGTTLLQTCFMGKGHDDKLLEWSVDGVRNQIIAAESLVARGQDSSQ